jgi:hypothetical protein
MLITDIAFGPLGPPQHLAYSDARVRVDVVYRIAPDRKFGTGPAGVRPSIAAGSVSYVIAGVRHVVDLAAAFPIHEYRIDLSAEGSCAPLVALIDLDRGTVLERVVLDHPSAHRNDARPQSLVGESLRVEGAQIVNVTGSIFQPSGSTRAAPWWVVAVRAVDVQGRERDLAYCAADYCDAGGERPPSETIPRIGSRIVVGSLQGGVPFIESTMLGERVVRLSRSDEMRFEARETPMPADFARTARRNSWFIVVDREADAEQFDSAIAALQQMVAIDETGPPLDPSITAMDRAELANCRAVVVRVRAGTLSKADAKALFTTGCVAVGRPAPSGSRAQ